MQKDLTAGPITKTMLAFAGPMIAGNLLQQFYNIADSFVVGQFVGPDALAAVGSAYTPVSYTHLAKKEVQRDEKEYHRYAVRRGCATDFGRHDFLPDLQHGRRGL